MPRTVSKSGGDRSNSTNCEMRPSSGHARWERCYRFASGASSIPNEGIEPMSLIRLGLRTKQRLHGLPPTHSKGVQDGHCSFQSAPTGCALGCQRSHSRTLAQRWNWTEIPETVRPGSVSPRGRRSLRGVMSDVVDIGQIKDSCAGHFCGAAFVWPQCRGPGTEWACTTLVQSRPGTGLSPAPGGREFECTRANWRR